MKYYIDGHNLIPKIPGLSLTQMDDEEQLLGLLVDFAREKRRSLEVFFDQAPDGRAGRSNRGTIVVHHVNNRTKADEEIIRCVSRCGVRASEITVVSSDNHVKLQCRSLGANVMNSEDFSKELQNALSASGGKGSAEPQLSESEVDEWLKLFSEGRR